jgi:hypothetical protein
MAATRMSRWEALAASAYEHQRTAFCLALACITEPDGPSIIALVIADGAWTVYPLGVGTVLSQAVNARERSSAARAVDRFHALSIPRGIE